MASSVNEKDKIVVNGENRGSFFGWDGNEKRAHKEGRRRRGGSKG